jgi:positive phototaxis protein PixI
MSTKSPGSSNPARSSARTSLMSGKRAIDDQSQQFLSLYLPRDQQAIVPTDSLIEILTLSPHQIIPIPDTPSSVMGVSNWRGEVLWLVDAGYLLSQEASFSETNYQTKFSVAVLQHQQRSLGLVVDRVGNMMWCLPAEIRSTGMDSTASRCLMGSWQPKDQTNGGESFLVLDPDLILDLFAPE